MDEDKNQELPELDLEAILKEFGGGDTESPAEAPAESEETAVTQETVRIETETVTEEPEAPAESKPEASVTGDTVRLEHVEDLREEVKEEPEGETREETPAKPEKAPEKPEEAFTENWEPEYEEPMGEYIPPQPIPFRPRARLADLKRKIIAGPEKRYYTLSEQGVGKSQIALLLSLLTTLLSAGLTAAYAFGALPESRLKLVVFVQFFAMLFSALLGNRQLIQGVTDVFHKRFSLNTMLFLTFAACCVDGVLGLQEERIPCCAAFSLEMTMAIWAGIERHTTEMGQMDTLRKANLLDGLFRSEDFYEGRAGVLRGEGKLEDFLDNYQALSKPEKASGRYALIAFLAGVALGVVGGVFHGVTFGVQVLSVSLLAAVPASFFVAYSRPAAILERKLHRVGAVICGWKGVEGFCGKVSVPVSYTDLFPVGSVLMNGVKFYGKRDPQDIIAYASALIRTSESGLSPIFDRVLESRNGCYYDVDAFRTYDNGGIGGEINGEPVLVGVLPFMKEMGVEVPEGIRVNQGVYVAVDGELCGLFALNFSKDLAAAGGMAALCASGKLQPVLTSTDFFLTENFVAEKFSVNTRRMAFPEEEVRKALAVRKPEPEAPALALMTRAGLASGACAITGARALRSAAKAGNLIHMIGGGVGLALMAALTVLGRADLLTPNHLFLFQLVWMIPGLIASEWTRTV